MFVTSTKPLQNLAVKWAKSCGRTVQQARKEHDDGCIFVAGEVIEFAGRGRLAYFNDVGHPVWRYHAAAEIDGMIHDLWTDEVMSTEDYLARVMLGGWVDYPAEEVHER